MIFLNLPHTVSNIVKLIYVNFWKINNLNWDNLRTYYIDSLKKMQWNNINTNSWIEVSFWNKEITKIAKPFAEEVWILEIFSKEDQIIIKDKIAKALTLLEEIDKELFDIINLIITDIVVLKWDWTHPSVTSSKILWVIYVMFPSSELTVEEFAETILHETIHINIFLWDIIHKLFIDNVFNIKALSSVRIWQIRDFDASFHAACVAVSLMYYYNLLWKKFYMDKFLEPTIESIDWLKHKSNLLSDYWLNILNDIDEFVKSKNFNLFKKYN